jgi:5-methylcytosine-specific restriction protein A
MLSWLRDVIGKKEEFGADGRSSKWPSVRARHIAKNPCCMACGGKDNLEAHHIIPFSVDRSRELDPQNLVTLCGTPRNCHLGIGHAWNWQSYRPDVLELIKAVKESNKKVVR